MNKGSLPALERSQRESGNVFLIILIGIALFAALAFVISRGMRSETTSSMTSRQAELGAVDILDFAQRTERAVAKLQQKGVSESDIDFSNDSVTGYDHGVPQPDNHRVFSKDGGGASWRDPPDGVNDGSKWLFTASTCIPGVGTGDVNCASSGPGDEELLIVLPKVKQSICQQIDKRIGIDTVPSGGGMPSTAKFIGVFADGVALTGMDGQAYACVESGGDNYFYYTLMAR